MHERKLASGENFDDLLYGDENILKLLRFSFQFTYWTFDQRFDEIIDGESTKIWLIFSDAEKSIGKFDTWQVLPLLKQMYQLTIDFSQLHLFENQIRTFKNWLFSSFSGFKVGKAALSAAVKWVLILELEAESGPAKNQDESRFDFGEMNKKTKA